MMKKMGATRTDGLAFVGNLSTFVCPCAHLPPTTKSLLKSEANWFENLVPKSSNSNWTENPIQIGVLP